MNQQRPLREFYVNGQLQFSLWFDPTITSPKKIMEGFLNSKDWKFQAWYCGWEVVSWKCSRDLLRFKIEVKDNGKAQGKK